MSSALVGFSGFVGSNINSQMNFDFLYNSKNIQDIKDKNFKLLIFSGAKAEKWLANQNPEKDREHIDSLISILSSVNSEKFVLISTIDVYRDPKNVTEDSPTEFETNHAYGRNRAILEQFCQSHFKECYILRLPGLYGKGIKKNVVFDFLNENQIEKIDSRGSFQFYNLAHISSDINSCLQNDIHILNLSVEPILVADLAKTCFDLNFKNEYLPSPASYNFKSKYSDLWQGRNGYLYSKENCLEEMKSFVKSYKAGLL